jgi:beta-lactamase superfamily II metal-dependent hydrolase
MMQCKNIFFPVGQGGFMYSSIQNKEGEVVDFIYDCGSKTGGDKNGQLIVQKNIDILLKKLNNKKYIDTLIISHFDIDHINGVSMLLKTFSFKNILYPFHDLKTKSLYLIQQIYKAEIGNNVTDSSVDNIIEIIFNIEEFFQKTSTERVNIISISNLSQMPETFIPESELWPEMTISEKRSLGYINRSPIRIICKKTNWIFYPFMPSTDENHPISNQLLKIISGIEVSLSNNSLKDYINKNKKNIRNSYKGYLKSIKGDQSVFNRLSLMFYSGLNGEIKSNNKLCPITTLVAENTDNKVLFPQPFKESNSYGLLLTGDANLKGNTWQKKLQCTQSNVNLCEFIHTMNLPHHGSRHNCDQDSFINIKNLKNILIFYGLGNQYRHPHPDAIQNALSIYSNIQILHVNQFTGYIEKIWVH